MNPLLTTSNVTLTIGILAILFSVYNYFKDPQEKLDKRQAVSETEVDGKAKLLAQQFQWDKELNDKKFTDITTRIADAFTLAQNHTHSVEVKVDGLTATINIMSNEITKLSTIISERIPQRGI